MFKGIRNFLARRLLGKYEATQSPYPDRSILSAAVQDARFDISAGDRLELVRRHRYWVNNSPIVQKLRSLFIQYTVGPNGLTIVPNSSEELWNVSRAANWDRWSCCPSVSSGLTLVEEQQNWAGALFDDGEVFILRTLVKNQPRIQTLEGHRCLTPPKSVAGSVYDQIVDGVELDPVTGERLAYWFVDSDVSAFSILARPLLGGTRFIRVDARFVTHIYKCRRPGMLRGIPEGFSALNLLHDFQDLQLMQVKVARRIATIANVVYNNAGEKSFSDLRKSRLGVGTPSTVPQSDMTDRPRYYEQLSGGSTIYARTGEKIEQFPGDRPTVAETGFTDLLLSQICAAYNIPKLMVAPYSLQGTVTRADLDICANGFRTNFEVVKKGLLSIYNWHGEWARNYDRSMDGDFPEDYQKTVVRPPRSPNVDVGRNASALRTELELGTLTYQDVFAERQQDYREQFRQAAESYKFAEDLAKEFGIPVEGIFKKVQFSVGAPSNTSPATVMEGV